MDPGLGWMAQVGVAGLLNPCDLSTWGGLLHSMVGNVPRKEKQKLPVLLKSRDKALCHFSSKKSQASPVSREQNNRHQLSVENSAHIQGRKELMVAILETS